MNKIKILHVVSTLKQGSGDTEVIMNYYRNIDRSKVKFDFLYFKEYEQNHIDEIKRLGGEVHKINKPNIKNLIYYKRYILNFIKERNLQYDIIHFHEILLIPLIAPQLKKFGMNNIIAHSHSISYSSSKLRAIRNYILCIPMKSLAKYYCSCSNSSAKFWFGVDKVNKGKVNIIKNAIDRNRFYKNDKVRYNLRNQLNLNDKFVIGHVGRFCKEKNQIFLIELFSEIIKLNDKSILLLIGDGDLIDKAKDKVDELNLTDKVIFLGNRNDVEQLYQVMDIFIFPSISEGLGMAAIEAQATGLKCFIANTITNEVNVSDSIFFSLDSDLSNLADLILKNIRHRKDTTNDIIDNGYCINIQSKLLLRYYERLHRGYD